MTTIEALKFFKDQYQRKNHDYGDSAKRTYDRFGDVAYMVRISDKLNRWNTLLKNENRVNNESLTDTVGDTFTYCCMWIAAQLDDNDGNAIYEIMNEAQIWTENDESELELTFEGLLNQFDGLGLGSDVSDLQDWAIRMAIYALETYAKMKN